MKISDNEINKKENISLGNRRKLEMQRALFYEGPNTQAEWWSEQRMANPFSGSKSLCRKFEREGTSSPSLPVNRFQVRASEATKQPKSS